MIFCCTLKECAEIFAMIKVKLGPKITDPPGFATEVVDVIHRANYKQNEGSYFT